MTLRSRRIPKTGHGRAGVAVLMLVAVVAGVTAASASNTAPAWAMLCLVASPILVLVSVRLFGYRTSSLVVSAPSLAVALQVLVFVVVPISWFAGFADPWPQFSDTMLPVVGAGLAFLTVFMLATGIAILRLWPDSESQTRGEVAMGSVRGERFLWSTLAVGTLGLLAFVMLQGGLDRAASSIYFARSQFAGFGVVFVPMLVPAFGVALGIQMIQRSKTALTLIGANAIVYLAGVFLTGFKVRAVLLFVVVLVAASIRWRLRWRYLALLVLIFVPVSVWYHYSVRTEWSLGIDANPIQVEGIIDTVASVWVPFSEDGLDVVRTLGTVVVSDRVGSESPMLILTAPITVVPSWLLPSKPTGSSVEFSKEFFGQQWAHGTGIPPSWAAELLWVFGWAGALLVYALTAVAIVASDAFILKRPNAAAISLERGSLAVFTVLLLKSGSGSAVRTGLLYILAAALTYVLWYFHARSQSNGTATEKTTASPRCATDRH